MKKKIWLKILSTTLAVTFVICGVSTTACLLNLNVESVQTTPSDESSQNISNDEENSTENVDNSGDLSTTGENSESDESDSGNNANDSGESGSAGLSGENVVQSTAQDGYWTEHYLAFSISQDQTNEISTARQLAYLSYMVNSGNTYEGYVFKLTADIDLSQYFWVPIGYHDPDTTYAVEENPFSGEFDGNGHTISGLVTEYVSSASDLTIYNYMGLFGYTPNAYIHDITLTDSTITGYCFVAGIVGGSAGKIYRCIVKSSTINGFQYVGGIFGVGDTGVVVSGCVNSASVTGTKDYMGGIGAVMNDGEIYDCCNTGSIEYSGNSGAGGIVGIIYSYTASSVYRCYNSGNVSGTRYTGGIVGGVWMRWGPCYVYDCYNTGSITGTGSHTGGIIGGADDSNAEEGVAKVTCCYNLGDVSGTYEVGGIAGSVQGNSTYETYSTVINCFNLGDVSSSCASGTAAIGGIAGGISYAAFSCCWYDCTISDADSTYTKGLWAHEDSINTAQNDTSLSYHSRTKSWYAKGTGYWHSNSPWNFSSVWTFDEDVNDGYPVLRSLLFADSLEWDESAGYWFFEDGKFPQSVVEDADLIEAIEKYAILTGETYAVGSEVFAVWSYGGSEYVKVTAAGASGTADDSGCTWFLVEPIRWIVEYGSERPNDATTAVSALVVTLGSYVASSTYDASFVSLYSSTLGNASEAVSSGDLRLSAVDSVVYDAFNTTVSQTAVFSVNLGNVTEETGNTTVTSAGYRVASVSEIDALGGAYATKCSDFVAFLLSGGSKTSGYVVDYWTRDLACELSSDSTYGKAYSDSGTYRCGIYITNDGVISNALLKNVYGARLSVALG